jgi:hypothetical protein
MPDPPVRRLDLGHLGGRGVQLGRGTKEQHREPGVWHKAIVTQTGNRKKTQEVRSREESEREILK